MLCRVTRLQTVCDNVMTFNSNYQLCVWTRAVVWTMANAMTETSAAGHDVSTRRILCPHCQIFQRNHKSIHVNDARNWQSYLLSLPKENVITDTRVLEILSKVQRRFDHGHQPTLAVMIQGTGFSKLYNATLKWQTDVSRTNIRQLRSHKVVTLIISGTATLASAFLWVGGTRMMGWSLSSSSATIWMIRIALNISNDRRKSLHMR